MGAVDDVPEIPEADELPDFEALAKVERVPAKRYQSEMKRLRRQRQAERARLFDPVRNAPKPPKRSGMTSSEFAALVAEQRESIREYVLSLSLDDILVEAYDQLQKHRWRYEEYEKNLREAQAWDRSQNRPPGLHTAHLNAMREEEKWGTEMLLRVIFPIMQERGKQKSLPGARVMQRDGLEAQLAGNLVEERPALPEGDDLQDDALSRAARGPVAFMDEEEVEEQWPEEKAARVPGVPR